MAGGGHRSASDDTDFEHKYPRFLFSNSPVIPDCFNHIVMRIVCYRQHLFSLRVFILTYASTGSNCRGSSKNVFFSVP